MLYPFVTPERLTRSVRSDLQRVAVRHEAFPYTQLGLATWPDALYVAVDPVGPFVALQADLAAAFPGFPIYGSDAAFNFVPHITVADGPRVDDAARFEAPAWESLAHPALASALEVIARVGAAPWRTVWRIGLGGHARSTAR